MPVRLRDLPKDVRDRITSQEPARARQKPRRGDSAPCAGSCSCGERFERYTAWERHCDREGKGHSRWSIDL